MIHSSFVLKPDKILNALKTKVKIKYNNKEIEVIALWDTGATKSCISMEVVEKLNLIQTGMIQVVTPSGTSERKTYLIDIVLPNNVLINNLQVSDSEIGLQKIGMLVGMNIISKGDFAITNFNGKTRFSFRVPSMKHIDFVQEMYIDKLVSQSHRKKKAKKK